MFVNCALFSDYISEVNNTQVYIVKDLNVMSLYGI